MKRKLVLYFVLGLLLYLALGVVISYNLDAVKIAASVGCMMGAIGGNIAGKGKL